MIAGSPTFISVEEVIYIHALQIETFGGTYGIRDQGLLISAVTMPLSSFNGNYLYPNIYHMTAAYLSKELGKTPCFSWVIQPSFSTRQSANKIK